MRSPLVRLTILRVMGLVAIVAFGLGSWVGMMRVGQRAQTYRNRAHDFADLEEYHRNRAAGIHNQLIPMEASIGQRLDDVRDMRAERFVTRDKRLLAYSQKMVQFEDRLADHYRALTGKYEDAATHPWEPLPPDPQE